MLSTVTDFPSAPSSPLSPFSPGSPSGTKNLLICSPVSELVTVTQLPGLLLSSTPLTTVVSISGVRPSRGTIVLPGWLVLPLTVAVAVIWSPCFNE